MDIRERYVNFYTDFAFKKLFGTEGSQGQVPWPPTTAISDSEIPRTSIMREFVGGSAFKY